jgi:hypothetical protein
VVVIDHAQAIVQLIVVVHVKMNVVVVADALIHVMQHASDNVQPRVKVAVPVHAIICVLAHVHQDVVLVLKAVKVVVHHVVATVYKDVKILA